MRRSELKRTTGLHRSNGLARSSSLERSSRLKAKPRAVRQGAAQAAHDMRVAVVTDAACAMCGAEGVHLEAHHALPARFLRDYCQRADFDDQTTNAIVYSPEVCIPLCGRFSSNHCHERHTTRSAVVPATRIPDRVHVFAFELGADAVMALEREHPDIDHWETGA